MDERKPQNNSQTMKNFFAAILSFFRALFGMNSKSNKRRKVEPADVSRPQDGSEIRPDTIINVNEITDPVIIDPSVPDKEFDEDPPEEQLTEIEDPAIEDIEEQEEATTTPEVTDKGTKTTDEDDTNTDTPPEVTEPEPNTHQARFLWCLDNGHGKQTKGKRSPVFDDGETQFLEYKFNRDIVARIIKQLDAAGVQYYNVVPEVDTDNFLEGRVNRANSKKSDLPKLFVSVHANAAPAKSSRDWAAASIKGIETWFYHNSKRGQKLASIFQKHLIDETGFKNRRLKSRPNSQFYVLRKTRMTAVLTENGFYNNKEEAAELMKDEVRQKIADAHVKAILEVEANGL